MSGSNRLESHDKLLDVKDEQRDAWNATCVFCGGKNLAVHPIGITFQPHTINNYDDLPAEMQSYYKDLPNIVEACIRSLEGERNTELVVECLDDGMCVSGFFNSKAEMQTRHQALPDKQVLKKYLMKLYGVDDTMKLKI